MSFMDIDTKIIGDEIQQHVKNLHHEYVEFITNTQSGSAFENQLMHSITSAD